MGAGTVLPAEWAAQSCLFSVGPATLLSQPGLQRPRGKGTDPNNLPEKAGELRAPLEGLSACYSAKAQGKNQDSPKE